MKPLSAEWLSGYFDVRGSIFIHLKKRAGQRKKLFLRVTICGDSTLLMQLLQRFPNGTVRPGRSASPYLEYTGREARKLLEAIKPWSVLKREQIETALEFINTIPESGVTLDEPEYHHRLDIAQKLRQHKSRA